MTRRSAPSWAALGLYAALAVLSFLPQSLRPRDTVAYIGDSLESVYIVAWNAHQVFRNTANLWEANILYPHRRALTFTDHRLLPSVAVAPLVWATGNPVLAYNVAVLLVCLLAAMGARRLALVLGLDPVSAWAAGALYAFHTYQVNEAPRLNIIAHGFIPLAIAELVLYLANGRRRHAWRLGALMLLQGLSSNYHLLYAALLVGLILAGVLARRPRLVLRRLPALVLATVAAGALFLPVALAYIRTSAAHGLVRDLPSGIDLVHYVSTSPRNWIYGAIGAEVRLQQRGPHFVGFLALALGAATVLAGMRRRGHEPSGQPVSARVWVPAAAGLFVLLVLLSLGKDVVAFGQHVGPGPYRLLHAYVPGFQLVRIPERLGLLAMLFLALLAGRALSRLREAGYPRVALLLAAALPAEHISPLPQTERIPVGRSVPEVYRFLDGYPTHAIAEVPTRGEGLVRKETVEAYFSTYHWKPIIHGYTAYPPLLTRMLRRAADGFPSESTLQAFQRVGVNTVIVHWGRDDDSALRPAVARAVAAGRIAREALFEGPAARAYEGTADEVFRLVPTPPLPAAPFPRGRRLRDPSWTYRTKVGDPAPAADGDLRTSWVVDRDLRGDEFFEVAFGKEIPVAGVVLPLRLGSVFPTRFRIAGKLASGRWMELAHLTDTHQLQLIDQLRHGVRSPVLGFDLKGRALTAIMIQVAEDGESFDGWSLPEVEVWVP